MGVNAASSGTMASSSGVTVTASAGTWTELQNNQVTIPPQSAFAAGVHRYVLSVASTGTASFTGVATNGVGAVLEIAVCYWIENAGCALTNTVPCLNPSTCTASSAPWKSQVSAADNSNLITYSWSGNYMQQPILVDEFEQVIKIKSWYKSTFQETTVSQWKILPAPNSYLNSLLIQLN
jgi:hypothetical protein